MNQPISAFFDRYAVQTEVVDLSLLQEIIRAFAHLPYENITKILKASQTSLQEGKLRQPAEVIEDHLRWGTGGTCFSLCNTLKSLLDQCGYKVFIAMADMHYGANIHCAVIVEFHHDRYLVDPGYLLHLPIRLPDDCPETQAKTPMNTVVLRSQFEDVFSLYTIENGETKWRYRLRAVPTDHSDFLGYWLRSFSLNTMENLMLSRLSDQGRIYFRKDRLDVVTNGRRGKRIFRTRDFSELSAIFTMPADLIAQAHRALLARPDSVRFS